ncbi:C-type lectin mosGCTL-7-like [Cochliomyia hominivorax]
MLFNFKSSLYVLSVILLDLLGSIQAQFSLNDIGVLQIAGDKQYFVEKTVKFNWYKAQQACAKLNMTLASITSSTEQQNLKNLLSQNSAVANQYWISGTDLSKSNEFVWFGNGQPFSYTSWGSGPGNSPLLRCVRTDFNFNWERASCIDQHYFICEKPVLPKCGKNNECIKSPTIIF